MSFRNKRTRRVDPEQLLLQAETSIKQTREQQPRVNAITNWLNNRRDENGFGTDFEYTLRPKGV